MKLQNTETTNMLNVDTQMKNATASHLRIRHELEEQVENEEVRREKGIGERQQQCLAHAGHQRPEARREHQRRRERADVEPGKVLEARFDRHRVAQRAQQVIRAHQHEEVAEGERDCRFLAGLRTEYLPDQRE